jgi:SSS family solute:Na+ symporter
MTSLDGLLLLGFLIAVAVISLLASRGERTRDEYFLAGRSLPWWLVGFSLIASNISTEHFVGMTGSAARSGLAVASYEWLAAPALVFVAWWLLPRFLRAGIATIPEFLEYRFDRGARTILAALMALFTVLTVLATVLYSGATFLSSALELPAWLEGRFGLSPAAAESLAFQLGVWGIGLGAGLYTVFGGLKAVVWSDLLQGAALLLGGGAVTVLALSALGEGEGLLAGWQRFVADNAERLHVVRAWNDPEVPSLALVSGLWIPVMFYWGLNQFITQRTLAAGSLAQGQLGLFFAAGIKLLLPLIVVVPGLLAVPLLGEQFDPAHPDRAYPTLLRELLPAGAFGLMLAAIAGAVMSTFNSGLNSAATVVTLDLWAEHVAPGQDPRHLVRVGRWITAVLAVGACLWAPVIHRFDGVYAYIQELWGFVSAPTCAVFAVGLWRPRCPPRAAQAALVLGPLLYLLSRGPAWLWTAEEAAAAGGAVAALHAYASMAFLNHMFVLFLVLVAGLCLWERMAPLPEPRVLPDRSQVDVTPHRFARGLGLAVLGATALLYVIWW